MAQERRSVLPKAPINPGPYEAIVVSHLDTKFMGSLQVELLKNSSSGNQPERTGQVVTVSYMSPFYNSTPLNGNNKNDTYQNTQQVSGFWAVPPDVGTKVIVIFVEGNISNGYWIGCVQDMYMNFTLPESRPGSKFNNEDTTQKLPVGEFNKAVPGVVSGNVPSTYLKPVNKDFEITRGAQGLLRDEIRGISSASARREVPSMVFGISTPGPLDKRDGAPKSPQGLHGARDNIHSARLGGTSLVFDDGDDKLLRKSFAGQGPSQYADVLQDETDGLPTIPFNESVRLRTRTGHQILLHNSEDLIYIGNARGSSWIEMSSNGKIDIFADDSISIRTSVDLNISADRDINMSASRDVNINAGRDYKMTAAVNSDVKIGVNSKIDVGADLDQFVGANQKLFVGGSGDLIVTDAHSITSKATLDILTVGDRKDKQANLDLNTPGYNYFTAEGDTQILSGGNHVETATEIHMNGQTNGGPEATSAAEATEASQALVAAPALFPVRVPQHEPWLGHESLDPLVFTPSKTNPITSPSPTLRETTPLVNDARDEQPVSGEYRQRANVDGAQTVVPGEVGPVGDQPAKPVPVTDLQQFFLNELITKLGLDPATCLNSANPDNNPEGVTAGNAEYLAMAMAQPQAECGFKPRSENLNYSARRLRQVYPSRVKTDAFAQELANAGPAAIGNTLYGGRYGNAQDEGYKYRGRGLIQLTFKGNYETYGGKAGTPEIVENPDLVNDPIFATKIAVAYIASKGISPAESSFSALGESFRKAVGYANQGGAETSRRIGIGKGFYSKLVNGELTPKASLTTEPAGTNIEAGKGVDQPISGPQ